MLIYKLLLFINKWNIKAEEKTYWMVSWRKLLNDIYSTAIYSLKATLVIKLNHISLLIYT